MLRVVWKGEHPIPDNETRERLNKMRKAEVLTDLVLMSDGRAFPCHRILLTNASCMIRDVVQMNTSMLKVPTIIVDDSHVRSMEKFLDCVYLGFQQVESNTLESIVLLANQLQVAIRLEGCNIPKKHVQVETFAKTDKPKSTKKSKDRVRKNIAKLNDDGLGSKESIPQVEQVRLINVVNAGRDVIPQQKSLPVKKAKETKANTVKSASEPKAKKPRVAVAAFAQEKHVPSDEMEGEVRPQAARSEKVLSALRKNKVDKKSKERKPKSTEVSKNKAAKPAKVSRKKVKLPEIGGEGAIVEQQNVLPQVQMEARPIIPMGDIQPDDAKMTEDSFSKRTALVARRKRKMSLEILDMGECSNRENDRALFLDERTGRFSVQIPNLQIPDAVSHSIDFKDLIPEDCERPRRAAFRKAMQNFRGPSVRLF